MAVRGLDGTQEVNSLVNNRLKQGQKDISTRKESDESSIKSLEKADDKTPSKDSVVDTGISTLTNPDGKGSTISTTI